MTEKAGLTCGDGAPQLFPHLWRTAALHAVTAGEVATGPGLTVELPTVTHDNDGSLNTVNRG